MTTPKLPKLPDYPPHKRCGYHNENGEQCEKHADHCSTYDGSDPKLVGTNCTVGGASFDGPEAAKRLQAKLRELESTVKVERAGRHNDMERAVMNARIIANDNAHEANKLKNDVVRAEKARDEAEARAQARHADWLKLREAEVEARQHSKDLQWKLDASERERTGLTELLRRNREACNAEREQLLMRQGLMLDQLDRILLREGQRARDPALRCGAQQLDRCVLLDSHEGLHDDGCGTRWGDVNGQSEPANCAKCQGEGCSRCVGP